MKVELIDSLGSDLSAVNAARVSMNKESSWKIENFKEVINDVEFSLYKEVLDDKDAKLIDYLARNKHSSCFEHQVVTMRLKVPLFIARQIQRHRTFSYNEISRRYVKDELEFYWPEKWRKAADNVKQGSSDEEVTTAFEKNGPHDEHDYLCQRYVSMQEWMEYAVKDAVYRYELAIERGVCAEQARMILPQNLYTQFYMTGNLRNWVHFVKLRTDAHAQREVQEIANAVGDILSSLYPVSYKALMTYD